VAGFNDQIIEEFRANEGQVGGNFADAPMILLNHRGRKSGAEMVSPTMYLPDEENEDVIYVFATNAGKPANPAGSTT